MTNYHSVLPASSFQCVNKTERKTPNLLFFFTGLIPSINFISPLNRHYVKMRGATRIFKSESGHFSKLSEPAVSSHLIERQGVSVWHQSVVVWKLLHNTVIRSFPCRNTNDWHQSPDPTHQADWSATVGTNIILLSPRNIHHQNLLRWVIIFTCQPSQHYQPQHLQGNYVLFVQTPILRTIFRSYTLEARGYT